MRIPYNILIAGFCALLFLSCKKNSDPSAEDLGYSYFPINDGDYSIYTVVDTLFNGIDKSSGVPVPVYIINNFFLKEEIHEPITVDDETRYEVYRYIKKNGADWNDYPDAVWTEFNTNGRIVRVEDNVRYVRLVFPFSVGKIWNGIADTSYTMTNIFRPYTYDSHSYPKTVSVIQFNDSSAIGSDYSIEVYADETGLVYKEIKVYNYDQSNLANPMVSTGRHHIEKLIEHGRYK